MGKRRAEQNGAPPVEPYSGQVKATDVKLPGQQTVKREQMRERALVVGAARCAAFQRATQGKGKPMKYPEAKA
jgi:hypothetical protein